MKYIRYIFYLEIIINTVGGFQSLYVPGGFMAQFSSQTPSSAANEIARWYGVLIAIITWLLFRALQARGWALKLALESLLMRDVIQIVIALVRANALGWSANIVFSLVMSVILGATRIVCLRKPSETGIE